MTALTNLLHLNATVLSAPQSCCDARRASRVEVKHMGAKDVQRVGGAMAAMSNVTRDEVSAG